MDILANLVTATQLQAAAGTNELNQDEWCYYLAQLTGTPCPAYDVGNPPSVKTTAQVFLDGLRNWELGINASNQQAGAGSVGGSNTPAPAQQMGVLGPTNCQFCIWLRKNPWVILLALVAIYFGFFYKKG